jgi:CHAT domain-containing protein
MLSFFPTGASRRLLLAATWLLFTPVAGANADDLPPEIVKFSQQTDQLIVTGQVWQAERRMLRLLEMLKPYRLTDSVTMCVERVKLAGAVYAEQGRLQEAQRILREEVAKLKKHDQDNSPGLDPIDYPQAVYLLAKVQMDRMRNSTALRLFDEVIDLLEGRNMANDIVAARAHKNKGLILSGQGDYAAARSALAKSLASQETSPTFRAAVEQSLATCWLAEADEFRHEGAFKEAGQYLTQAEAHQKKAEAQSASLQPTPAVLGLVGLIELSRAKLDSLRLSVSAKQKTEWPLGAPVQLFFMNFRMAADAQALDLNSEALEQVAAGAYMAADDTWTKAKQLLENSQVPNRRLLGIINVNQANLRTLYLGRAAEAAPQAAAALDEFQSALADDLDFQTAREQQAHIVRGQQVLSAYLCAAVKAQRPPPEIYERVFRWKGLLLEHALSGPAGAAHREKQRQLVDDRDEAQNVYKRALEAADATPADKAQLAADLKNKEEALATFLRDKAQRPNHDATAAKLAARMQPDTVYIEYEAFLDGTRFDAARGLGPDDVRYAAFILRAGRPLEMKVLPTPVHVVNNHIVAWRKHIAPGAERNPGRAAELAAQIAEALWRPLKPACEGAPLLWICPAGVLWAFPFAALPDPPADYLIRRLAVGYAVSGRQALFTLESAKSRKGLTGRGLVVADIEYAGAQDAIRGGRELADEFASRLGQQNVRKLLGAEATKPALLTALHEWGQNVCFIGHFPMTHRVNDLAVYLQTFPELRRRTGAEGPDPLAFQIPLAGADLKAVTAADAAAWLTRHELARATPLEASRFEVWACSGLLGPSTLLDGMESFPQELLRAGYRIVLAAQWNVLEHAALATLPESYHTALAEGLGDAQALRSAQCDALDLGGPNTDPYHWAAWVVMGDPGPATQPAPKTPVSGAVSSSGDGPRQMLWPILGSLLAVSILAWIFIRLKQA